MNSIAIFKPDTLDAVFLLPCRNGLVDLRGYMAFDEPRLILQLLQLLVNYQINFDVMLQNLPKSLILPWVIELPAIRLWHFVNRANHFQLGLESGGQVKFRSTCNDV